MGAVRGPVDRRGRRCRQFLDNVAFNGEGARRLAAAAVPVPESLAVVAPKVTSTQFGFGKVLDEIARAGGPLADAIVTTSPDVTVSTNLGPWVNRRGLFARETMADIFREERVASSQKWEFGPHGQHIELGIAEMNLFILLSALGLSHSLFGSGCCRSARSTIRSSSAASMR